MDNTIFIAVIIVLCVAFVAALLYCFVMFKKVKAKNSLIDALSKDTVTGLNTRTKFCEEVEKILKDAKPGEYMLISLDIDSFKIINEIYGYKVGTLVLEKVSELLTEAYSEQSIIARDKDDVFLVFRSYTSSQRNICFKEMCDDCLIKGVREILGEHYDINFSRGSYKIDNTQESINLMIDLSNRARMEGKKIHGTTYFEFTEQMRIEREQVKKIVYSMENALKSGEFKLFYQPKIELKAYTIAGAEALVRWFTSDDEQISPDKFIHIFEENNFINELDFYVFEEACKFISVNSSKVDVPRISVNVSGVTLMKNKNIVQKLSSILRKHKLSRNAVDLEITESFFVKDIHTVSRKVEDLRDAGFKISIDDFGSGESSLNSLRDIKVDTLKLDKELLNYNLNETRGTIIVGNLIKMAKNLMTEIVAEGIEDQYHLDMLRMLKCDMAQGYLFEKPLNEHDFLQILEQKKNYDIKAKNAENDAK